MRSSNASGDVAKHAQSVKLHWGCECKASRASSSAWRWHSLLAGTLPDYSVACLPGLPDCLPWLPWLSGCPGCFAECLPAVLMHFVLSLRLTDHAPPR